MVEKNNATCSICGRSYYKCLSCRDSMQLQPWKMFTDTSEHYKVFQAVRGYNTGAYTKEEFKAKLKNIDLSDLEDYKDSVKFLIKEVLKEKPVAKAIKEIKSVEVEVTEVKEEEVIEDVVEVENPENNVKPTIARKKNYKVDAE